MTFWFVHVQTKRRVPIETRAGLAHCLASSYWREVERR